MDKEEKLSILDWLMIAVFAYGLIGLPLTALVDDIFGLGIFNSGCY